jgi:hypothetical protein
MSKANGPIDHRVRQVLASLKELGAQSTLEGMEGYGIDVTTAFGVPMNAMQAIVGTLTWPLFY